MSEFLFRCIEQFITGTTSEMIHRFKLNYNYNYYVVKYRWALLVNWRECSIILDYDRLDL